MESVPFLGRTWYSRGTGYWVRRVALSVMLLVLAAADIAFLGWLVFTALQSQGDWVGGVLLLVFLVAVGVGTVLWIRPRLASAKPNSNSYGPTVALAGAGASILYVLIRTRTGLGAVLLLLGAIVMAGPLVLFFFRSLSPRIAVEQQAWARLNEVPPIR